MVIAPLVGLDASDLEAEGLLIGKTAFVQGFDGGVEALGFHHELFAVQFDGVFLEAVVFLHLLFGQASTGMRQDDIESFFVGHGFGFSFLPLGDGNHPWLNETRVGLIIQRKVRGAPFDRVVFMAGARSLGNCLAKASSRVILTVKGDPSLVIILVL